ncbi:hypothetical protein ACFQL1_12080 [Halomicroarcula sp. GCM10025709]|uniref:DUF7533 family protein n=1 Tax=Haloarcula TaxID=2237 RepID=UPI0024C282DE|nr:hypothetical protein [Halomicroarcula sp. YJ-61-S]
MAGGILDTIGLLTVVVFAIPVALFGAEHLLRGEFVAGVGFLAIAAGMVAIEQYLVTPTDLPSMAAEKTVGAVAKTDEDDDQD